MMVIGERYGKIEKQVYGERIRKGKEKQCKAKKGGHVKKL